MAKTKGKSKGIIGRLTAWLSGFSVWAVGPGRSLLLGGLAIVLLAGAVTAMWREVGEQVLSSHDYIVAAEDLDIGELPPWIHSDITSQAFECLQTSGGRISIMDNDAVERVAKAFSLHPWVKRVVKVSKHHPAKIRVELEYRRPACMVVVKMADGSDGLCPVDTQGVYLPTADFSSVEARRYPWLTGFRTSAPAGGAGHHWGDERVVGAAEIAAAFQDDWTKLGLERIEPVTPERTAYQGVYDYLLFTRGGTKIIWGRPPGSELPSEAAAADKIAKLKEFAEVRGSLDSSNPRLPIDARGREGIRLLDRMANDLLPDYR